MPSKVFKKINAKLKFLYLESRYLTPSCGKLLRNALIQRHFDYGCSSWFPLLKKNLKNLNFKKLKTNELYQDIFMKCLSLHKITDGIGRHTSDG